MGLLLNLKTELQENIEGLYQSQQRDWPGFAGAVAGLSEVRCREVQVDRRKVRLQFNPRRLANALAPASPEEVAARPCFLCSENRPPEQVSIPFDKRWLVVCNPFPLLKHHVVVIDREHTPQSVNRGTLGAMLSFTLESGYTTLYNGPKSGASAPDHLHFQALPPGGLPLERQIPARATAEEGIFPDSRLPRRIYLSASDPRRLEELFSRLLEVWNRLTGRPAPEEPEMNLVVLPYGTGGTRDKGAARKTDHKLHGRLMRGIFREVCLPESTFAALAAEIEKRKK